ncbi:hypothetical protein [Pectobacterium brasiliense]|uniref:hypothetical protein n=1 Tax=Pectobacterium brasiliense TaxID=180957 RepID=UPI0019694D12|nr:hypothetical protein [Pectobacterium brasiliense]
MTPEYRIDAERRITEYLKSQNLENIKNMQVEQTFNDLGFEVNIWNVRTKTMEIGGLLKVKMFL